MVCDASTSVIGEGLEQNSEEGWVAAAYASHLLISLEEKYSVNELEFGPSKILIKIYTENILPWSRVIKLSSAH